jgi:hypothetical protein
MLSAISALICVAAAQAAPGPGDPPPPDPPPATVPLPAPTPATQPAAPPPPPAIAVPVEAEPEPAPLFRESSNDAFGDTTMSGFSLRTLIQVRFGRTFQPGSATADERATVRDNDGWRLHRAFLRLVAAPNKRLQSRITVDFAELMRKNPKRALKNAYAQLQPWKWLEVSAGVFKRTYSLLELLPIADFELSEEGPTDEFIKDLGYAGRDVGGMIRVSPLSKKRHLGLWLGAFAGDPEEGYDATIGKLLTARAESRPFPFVRLGADMAWRTGDSVGHEKFPDYLTETLVLESGRAYSADVTVSMAGFELRLEGLMGDRTDFQWRKNATDFVAAWTVATYRFPLGAAVVMPAVRAEWLDVDRQRAGGGRFFLTAAINLDINANLRLLIDASRYDVQSGAESLRDRPWPMPVSGPDYEVRVKDVDWWQVIAQLQLKI